MPLKLAGADQPLGMEGLSSGERHLHDRLPAARRRDWLLGRAALKQLLRRTGEPEDSASISFPNPRYSISHSEGCAVAVGVSGGRSRGIGVDLERRLPRPEAAKLFLSPEERREAGGSGFPKAKELQRLWTVKEALFKADPENGKRRLADYPLAHPAMRHASVEFGKGVLTVAVLPDEEVCQK